MKQVISRKGEISIEDIPASHCDRNSVLVRVTHSVVSVGSEIRGVSTNENDSLVQRAIRHPSKALKAIDLIREKGIAEAIRTIRDMQSSLDETPAVALGYSCSGIVAAVGDGIVDLKVGDRVACAGLGKAVHAELVSVPKNLVVKVPDGVELREAASATIGAIAMQGVRRADVRIGEYVAVIGLGLIGQITAQILNAAGCRVIGIDLIEGKLELLQELGCYHAMNPETVDPVKEVNLYTADRGVDATIITAASQSDEIVQQAMEMTRKKGTVVVVGAVGLGLKRHPFYRKEIDLRISCSYGPGRYEEEYEEKGLDYPYAYVRWTENRNMEEYLRLIAEGKINFSRLVTIEAPVEEAPQVYERLKSPDQINLGVVFTYNLGVQEPSGSGIQVTPLPSRGTKTTGRIRVGLIGAGEFARAVHLPNLVHLSDFYELHAVASRNGLNAKETADRYNARYATTEYQSIISDPDIDMVLISTRHNLHASIAKEAARAGKAVFVEKPMALNLGELDELEAVIRETGVPFLVGFNRRFSAFALKARELIGQPVNPMLIFYRVNARHLPVNHWVHSEEGGGRLIGEACHMIDFFSFLTGASIVSADVASIDPRTESVMPVDNFCATIKYSDGSVCSLIYTAQGSRERGKEFIEIYIDGRNIVIDNFVSLSMFGSEEEGLQLPKGDKGHLQELKHFAQAIAGKAPPPIPLDSLVRTTRTTILLHQAVFSG
jgi:predicted dehydrogenase/threonine dehydrogenase-like Zn-dependent dehydrogenase